MTIDDVASLFTIVFKVRSLKSEQWVFFSLNKIVPYLHVFQENVPTYLCKSVVHTFINKFFFSEIYFSPPLKFIILRNPQKIMNDSILVAFIIDWAKSLHNTVRFVYIHFDIKS